jgi:hypothetical protein
MNDMNEGEKAKSEIIIYIYMAKRERELVHTLLTTPHLD